MPKRLVSPLLGVLLGLSACAPGSASLRSAPAPTWREEIAALAHEELGRTGLPSLQIAIGQNRNVLFEGAFGYADLENEVPATPLTKYRIASISKWLTGTAAMRLVERGILDLDAPIQKYCSEYPEKPWPITARHLLSHTSGIRHYADHDAMLAMATDEEHRAAIEEWIQDDRSGRFKRYTDVLTPLESFRDDPLLFEPGTKHAYTSYGFRVLGCVMQGAAGRPYRTLMQELLFDPAGLSTIVDDDSWAVIPHRASGYHWSVGAPVRRANFRDVSENLPAGGHLGTAADLVSFAQAFHAGRLVSAETIALMASQPTAKDGEVIECGYGHGLDLLGNFGGAPRHLGNQEGATSILVLFPEQNLSIAVLCNASGWPGVQDLTKKIYEIVNRNVVNAS